MWNVNVIFSGYCSSLAMGIISCLFEIMIEWLMGETEIKRLFRRMRVIAHVRWQWHVCCFSYRRDEDATTMCNEKLSVCTDADNANSFHNSRKLFFLHHTRLYQENECKMWNNVKAKSIPYSTFHSSRLFVYILWNSGTASTLSIIYYIRIVKRTPKRRIFV